MSLPGSGAIGAAVAHRLQEAGIEAEVHAADLDPGAVECARRNLSPERVHEGDLYDALPTGLRGRVDVLVVNAPYVPTDRIGLMPPEARDHEPVVALENCEVLVSSLAQHDRGADAAESRADDRDANVPEPVLGTRLEHHTRDRNPVGAGGRAQQPRGQRAAQQACHANR